MGADLPRVSVLGGNQSVSMYFRRKFCGSILSVGIFILSEGKKSAEIVYKFPFNIQVPTKTVCPESRLYHLFYLILWSCFD